MKNMTPTKLRLFLSASLFLIAAIGIGLFYIANRQLTTVAAAVSQTTADANASRNNIQTLQKIQDELASQQAAVKRASNIAANSQSYSYQNQIISDLNTYAGRAGISITNIDFSANTAGSAGTTPAAGATTPAAGAAAPSGLKTATISVTLKNPVEYTRLLSFFNMLEQSVPKLQISKINLSKSSDGNGGVSSEVLSIDIYIR